MGDSEVVLSTSDIAFVDHESRIKELEDDLASSMRWEFRMRQRLSVLEGASPSAAPRSSDLDAPHPRHCEIPGERGTPYPWLSQHLQMVHHSSGPPQEENCESWASDSSEACPMRLIPIEDVVVSPPLTMSSSEDSKYHKAPVEDEDEGVGITNVLDRELDLAGSKRISWQD